MIKNQYRFFVSAESFQGEQVFIKDPEIVFQIKKVLRLKTGDQVIFLDNSGWEYQVVLEKIEKSIEGQIVSKEKNTKEPKKKIILCQSLLKGDKFEQVLKFGTSLGLAGFVPVVTERSVVKEIGQNKFVRYQKIIQESAEQAGCGTLPKLNGLFSFEEMIDFLKDKKGLKLIAWEEEKSKELTDFQKLIKEKNKIYLIIGPEGGFSEREVVLAKENGFLSFSLGKLILRAEIAGIISTALLLSC